MYSWILLKLAFSFPVLNFSAFINHSFANSNCFLFVENSILLRKIEKRCKVTLLLDSFFNTYDQQLYFCGSNSYDQQLFILIIN